jgi:hypothetical protein
MMDTITIRCKTIPIKSTFGDIPILSGDHNISLLIQNHYHGYHDDEYKDLQQQRTEVERKMTAPGQQANKTKTEGKLPVVLPLLLLLLLS